MSTSQIALNQGLSEDQEMPSQMGFYSSPSRSFSQFRCHQSLRSLSINNPSSLGEDGTCQLNESPSSRALKQRDIIASHLGEFEASSVQKSTNSLWPWVQDSERLSGKRYGEDEHMGVSAMKMKKVKARRKVREPRFCFKTMSDVDVLDDGYKWRKYGQKVVKNTQHPRSYYRCTQDNCRVKKRVERLAEDPRMVITTYEGRHIHSPSHDLDNSQAPPQISNFFW
ncbi:PREDICTED: probable WRKY transcription factor 13 [Nelumbo nucifera]|uniref:WRKY domain-containing protein n=2 Tax=Nelumbo nucifera TaxID=4432 RepID=A0A822ZR22_NELNU|nr:PREDICTED: probable WRKY transcription factor 13 [Nelumbo nucifera]DAD47313.1 TPA_asm: hypothetical protein HUJ06_017250 [Nelumbo nucifera]